MVITRFKLEEELKEKRYTPDVLRDMVVRYEKGFRKYASRLAKTLTATGRRLEETSSQQGLEGMKGLCEQQFREAIEAVRTFQDHFPGYIPYKVLKKFGV